MEGRQSHLLKWLYAKLTGSAVLLPMAQPEVQGFGFSFIVLDFLGLYHSCIRKLLSGSTGLYMSNVIRAQISSIVIEVVQGKIMIQLEI